MGSFFPGGGAGAVASFCILRLGGQNGTFGDDRGRPETRRRLELGLFRWRGFAWGGAGKERGHSSRLSGASCWSWPPVPSQAFYDAGGRRVRRFCGRGMALVLASPGPPELPTHGSGGSTSKATR